MRTVLLPVLATLAGLLWSRALLHLEILALRQQLAMVTARDRKRLRFRRRDRFFWDGKDGSRMCDRANRYGKWIGKVGENISYGQYDPRDVVIQLIIDDSLRDRGHRDNIFDPAFRVVGVAFGGHSKYRSMCVTTFAAGHDEAVSAP